MMEVILWQRKNNSEGLPPPPSKKVRASYSVGCKEREGEAALPEHKPWDHEIPIQKGGRLSQGVHRETSREV